jgi:acetyl esterase/lipase
MIRRSTAWVAALLVAGLFAEAPEAQARTDPAQARVSAKTVREDVYRKAPSRYPGGVTGLADVEYANIVGYRPLLLDLYLPPKTPKAPARPLVIWIHGGGWNRGDSRTSGAFADWPEVLASLAARGYVVASVNYRLSGEARFPAAIQDVKASIRFLRAHAGEYGIDPRRVIVWGGSAGGQLAALVATACDTPAFAPRPSLGRGSREQGPAADVYGTDAIKAASADVAVSDCVQGAAIWYGVLDLSTTTVASVAAYLGCDPKVCAKVAGDASPLTHVGAGDPPMLLIQGLADRTVSPGQTRAMTLALEAAKVPVETLYIPGADHGWLGATPEATRDASLLALKRTFEFIDATVAGIKPAP